MSRRLVPVIGALLGTFAVGGWLIASPIIALVGVAATAVFLAVVSMTQRRSPAESSWSRSTSPTPNASPDYERERSTPREVSRALGAIESRELLYSPWFAVGAGLLVVIFVSFAISSGFDLGNGLLWMQMVHLAPWFAHPLAGMTIIAVFRAVTRSKRDDTDELFDGCPTGRDIRTAANLRTLIVPVAVYAVFLTCCAIAISIRSPFLHGPVGWAAVAIVVASCVLLVGAVFLGAALGAWLPYSVVPIVAMFAVGLVSLRIRSDGDPGWNGLASLSTVGPESDVAMLIPLTSPWAYLAWMAALTAIVGAIAMARHSRRRSVGIAGAAGVVVALVAGSFAVQPVDAGDAAEIAALILDPAGNQTCTTTPNQAISVCTYDDYPELRSRAATDLLPLAAELKGLAGPVTARQIYDNSVIDFPDRVRRIVGDALPEVPGNEVGIGFEADDDALRANRLAVALWALGAPHARGDEVQPESIAGQARGVLALWLAARGLDADDARDLASIDSEWGQDDDAFERGYAWPSGCAPVVWSAQDLQAARAIMTLPEQTVRRVLHDDLGHWSDPSTSTDELMVALGLEPVGPFEVIEARAADYC